MLAEDIRLTLIPALDDETVVDAPERRLLWALLCDVFFVRDSPWRRVDVVRQKACDREWIQSDDETPFSFLWVCQHLDLCPRKVRRAYLHGKGFMKPKRQEAA